MPKLTATFAKQTCNPEAGQDKHWDTEIKGFGLFCAKRAKTWYFQHDISAKTKRVRIGPYPSIAADAARETAQELALQFSRGAGKKAMQRVPTLRTAMDAYLSRPKLRSEKNKAVVRTQIEKHLGDWLDLNLDEIDRAMCASRHAALRKRPAAANHAMQSFRSIWNHARRKFDLPESPTIAIEWFPEQPKATVIDDLEKWHAEVLALINPIHRTYYRLLLLTGLRRMEAASLRWEHVFDDHLHLPMTKNGRPFDLPLTGEHHEILATVKGLDAEWVFPAWRGKSAHIVAPQRLSWTPHDHRRTFATIAQTEAGLFEETVGRLLNHTPQSVTGRSYVVIGHEQLKPSMKQVIDAFKRTIPDTFS